MKSLRFGLVATAVLGIVWVSASAVHADGKKFPTPREVATYHEVEYPNPSAWACEWEHGCLECKNISGQAAIVVVAHIHKLPPVETEHPGEEFHCVLANQKVLTCGPIVIVPAPGTKVADENDPSLCTL